MLTTATAALVAALLTGAPTPAAPAPAAALQVPSLLGAESLNGGSAARAWAGFSSLGLAYGQGVTAQDDLIASAELDWSSTELWLAGAWRRPLGTVGGWSMAGQLKLGWYLDLGGTWVHDDNRADRGLLLGPSLLLSTRAGDGLVSTILEVPLTLTFRHSGGFLLAPRASVAYEAPLYGDLTVGVRAGVSWRGGGGDAPMRAGRAEPELLVLVGYRVF